MYNKDDSPSNALVAQCKEINDKYLHDKSVHVEISENKNPDGFWTLCVRDCNDYSTLIEDLSPSSTNGRNLRQAVIGIQKAYERGVEYGKVLMIVNAMYRDAETVGVTTNQIKQYIDKVQR